MSHRVKENRIFKGVMKKFNDDLKIKALPRPLVIWFGIFILCCSTSNIFAQSPNSGSKIDKSKLTIHGNMRDAQPQHFDNSRSNLAQYSRISHKTVKAKAYVSHVKTGQGAIKPSKAKKKIKTHKKVRKSKRVH